LPYTSLEDEGHISYQKVIDSPNHE